MRILHAIANLSAETGGPPKACLGMAQGRARRGHDVAIYTTNYDGATDADVPLDRPVDEGGVAQPMMQPMMMQPQGMMQQPMMQQTISVNQQPAMLRNAGPASYGM